MIVLSRYFLFLFIIFSTAPKTSPIKIPAMIQLTIPIPSPL
ncbi:hypothetical protein HMPREF3203_01062 [Proteus mirabilis]|nr:hypothetical protein HMPREF3203_01062 [Proteus mirabilis]